MTQKDKKLIAAEIFNRCWDDEAYKAKFVADPAKVLAEAGIPVTAGKKYHVIENTENVQYVVLPEKDAAVVFEQFKNLAAQKGTFIPAGKEIRFVQNSATARYIILPQQPSELLTDEQLDQIAGGGWFTEDWFYTDADIIVQTEAVAQFHAAVQAEIAAAELAVAATVAFVI